MPRERGRAIRVFETGAGAVVITVTVSTTATGTSCIYQGYAQVMTS